MELWKKACLLLCCYGFFKEFRPSEPFLTEYLLSSRHGLTEDELYIEVYPVWTYSYLSLLVAVFLLTDWLRYKPVIVFEGLGYILTWLLLIWTRGVGWMQFMEFCYGIATSTEVAYYTYIYALVSDEHYQKVTSYTRASILSGRFLAGITAQVLFTTGVMDYYLLNFVSLSSVSVAFVIATALPSTSRSLYFHREVQPPEIKASDKLEDTEVVGTEGSSTTHLHNKHTINSFWEKIQTVRKLLWSDLKESYSNKYLLKWSIWWAFATAGNFQVGNYIQPLWESILSSHESDDIYNGVVEAVQTLLSALAALGIGYVHLNWVLLGELTLAVISVIDGLLLLFMGLTSDIWVAYVNYIVFRVSYQLLITIASFQVARELRQDCYALVFGVNMFMALLIQSILTFIVINVLLIPPPLQFIIYGCYFFVLATFFFLLSVITFCRMGCHGLRESTIFESSTNYQ